jgi:hypothetical protein
MIKKKQWLVESNQYFAYLVIGQKVDEDYKKYTQLIGNILTRWRPQLEN